MAHLTAAHIIPCDRCGQYFRTTDWPPATCKDCNREIRFEQYEARLDGGKEAPCP